MTQEDLQLQELLKQNDTESTTAYRAFLYFAQLPKQQRIIEKVIADIADQFRLSTTTVQTYFTENKWRARVAKLEAYELAVEIKGKAEAIKSKNDKYVEEVLSTRNELMKTAKTGLQVANKLLETFNLFGEEEVVEELELEVMENGVLVNRVIPIRTSVNMNAKLGDVAPILNSVNTTLKTLNTLTQKTSIIQPGIEPKPSLDLSTQDAKDLSNEEIEAELAKIRATLAESGAESPTEVIQ